MRPLWKDVLVAVWLGMILPGILLNGLVIKERHRETVEPQLQVRQEPYEGPSISVCDPDGSRISTNMDTYLTGVLLAEMPASFHMEALKAQAVAARTYCWKARISGGKHGDGSVCMDSACCQAYMTEDAYLLGGGTAQDLEKIQKAVDSTTGMVIAYGGELIEATYFSSSSGSTEAAQAVWGAEYPYLQPVSSPEEVRIEAHSYTAGEFQKLLSRELAGDPLSWFGAVTYTEGNGVDTLEICEETYTGTQLRKLLGLRSTDFSIQPDHGTITITTRGYGHRVGMSQYGANTLAEAGSTWQEILQHYYPGTTLVSIS